MIRLAPLSITDVPVGATPIGLDPAPCATIDFVDAPLVVTVSGNVRHLARLGDRITVTGQLPFTTVQALSGPATARVAYFTPAKDLRDAAQ